MNLKPQTFKPQTLLLLLAATLLATPPEGRAAELTAVSINADASRLTLYVRDEGFARPPQVIEPASDFEPAQRAAVGAAFAALAAILPPGFEPTQMIAEPAGTHTQVTTLDDPETEEIDETETVTRPVVAFAVTGQAAYGSRTLPITTESPTLGPEVRDGLLALWASLAAAVAPSLVPTPTPTP